MDHKARDCRPNDYNDQEAFALYLQWGLLQRSLGALFQCIENFLTMNKLVSHDGWHSVYSNSVLYCCPRSTRFDIWAVALAVWQRQQS